MGQLSMFRDLVAAFGSSGVGGRHYRGMWLPTLSLGACGCCTVLVMRFFGAVTLTCQALEGLVTWTPTAVLFAGPPLAAAVVGSCTDSMLTIDFAT